MGAETLNWRGILCILGVLSEVFSSLVRVMPRILGVLSEVFSSLVRKLSLIHIYGLWSGLFFTICPVISMSVLCYLTPKIRESNCYTVSQLLETKYGSKARTISAVIIALAMVSIVSYQYRGLGFILNATTCLLYTSQCRYDLSGIRGDRAGPCPHGVQRQLPRSQFIICR